MNATKETPLVVVFPRGQLTPKDKERLTKHGILAVEADSPKDVCQLHLVQPMITTMVSGDALLVAAIKAMSSQPSSDSLGCLNEAGRIKGEFVKLLAASMQESRHAE